MFHDIHCTTQVQQSLESCQQEVARLKEERNLYEENMKKAFMRGVCALNLEAMTMFQHQENESVEQQYINGESGAQGPTSSLPHVHPSSEARPTSQSFSHPDASSTQLPSSQLPGSKSVYMTTSAPVRAGPSSSQLGVGLQSVRSKLGQLNPGKRNIQRTSTRAPAVVVEKH